ncbi:hypothetical protein OXB_2708 [Bacillus sp. OxB-1]|uniref:hypothetical protein n=1 Tax=Bacillus sp. (strain OxB-1) TaxID=98228 RepID=UPI000582235B|nr:hypothetical protein [Bacillus sp. OxB-1]BAQ11179.1 hypothetical protein OXB_2708 [Bacillus sp. OxB-1]
MNVENLREQFIEVLEREFPTVLYHRPEMKSDKLRISPYVPNDKRDKRWMQIDSGAERLSIVMDHQSGDLQQSDLPELISTNGSPLKKTRIRLNTNGDAVDLAVFSNEPIDFSDDGFISFLRKHFLSYLRRVK